MHMSHTCKTCGSSGRQLKGQNSMVSTGPTRPPHLADSVVKEIVDVGLVRNRNVWNIREKNLQSKFVSQFMQCFGKSDRSINFEGMN